MVSVDVKHPVYLLLFLLSPCVTLFDLFRVWVGWWGWPADGWNWFWKNHTGRQTPHVSVGAGPLPPPSPHIPPPHPTPRLDLHYICCSLTSGSPFTLCNIVWLILCVGWGVGMRVSGTDFVCRLGMGGGGGSQCWSVSDFVWICVPLRRCLHIN